MSAEIIALVPMESGNPIVLQQPLILVGRSDCCDICIDHRNVSKLHCVIAQTEESVTIRDLESTNGCRVNGQRIKRSPLVNKDVLSIGGIKYRIFVGDQAGLQATVNELAPKSEEGSTGKTTFTSEEGATGQPSDLPELTGTQKENELLAMSDSQLPKLQ